MPALAENLFYIIFVGQILLISWYVPEQLCNRMRRVIDTYPPAQYPKLYPNPVEHYLLGQLVYKWVNRLIVLLGFGMLWAILFVVDHSSFADDGYISEAWPAFLMVIQGIPLIALEFSSFGQLRLMRQLNDATSRKAELRPRRLFDFVPRLTVVAAVVAYGASIAFDIAVNEFTFEWSNNSLQRTLWLTIGMLFMLAVGAWNLYGANPNPHQSYADRARQIKANLTSIAYASILMSIFYMTASADQAYDLDYLDAALISLYFQAIVLVSVGHMLRNLRIEDNNFDVYKEATPATEPGV